MTLPADERIAIELCDAEATFAHAAAVVLGRLERDGSRLIRPNEMQALRAHLARYRAARVVFDRQCRELLQALRPAPSPSSTGDLHVHAQRDTCSSAHPRLEPSPEAPATVAAAMRGAAPTEGTKP